LHSGTGGINHAVIPRLITVFYAANNETIAALNAVIESRLAASMH
jgi:hypothetical protein